MDRYSLKMVSGISVARSEFREARAPVSKANKSSLRATC